MASCCCTISPSCTCRPTGSAASRRSSAGSTPRGLVAPGQFIPLAEQTGLIGPLTHWVLEAARHQCQAWRRAGLQVYVAVNISLANVRDWHLPDTVARLLRTYDVPPAALRLEVTESILMADVARAREVLIRLAALGVGLSVDDFGTGHSSLAQLKRLPVDELKIDMSFVRHMAEDTTDRAIVASTVALGHSLGLVVAEGVEDGHTQQMLAELGCDVVQGYYMARPLPAVELVQWLREAQWAAALRAAARRRREAEEGSSLLPPPAFLITEPRNTVKRSIGV